MRIKCVKSRETPKMLLGKQKLLAAQLSWLLPDPSIWVKSPFLIFIIVFLSLPQHLPYVWIPSYLLRKMKSRKRKLKLKKEVGGKRKSGHSRQE